MNKHYCTINNWLIDQPSGSILHLVTGESKRLGMYQLKLLDVLLKNAGKIFTREELTTLVWERRVIGNNSLPNAIHALRTALEDDGKQQRIIRTIPKHGYVLEPEFCQVVEKDDKEVNLPSLPPPEEEEDILSEAEGDEETLQLQADVESDPLPVAIAPPPAPIEFAQRPGPVAPARSNCWKRGLTLAVIVLCIMTCWYLLSNPYSRRAPQELAKGVYSNIHLFTLPEHGGPLQDQASTYNRLKDLYYILDQELKAKSIKLSVYYNNANQTLNYTMRLYNGCEQKLLAMQIYHWRANPDAFKNLIQTETQRKINEMATCKAK